LNPSFGNVTVYGNLYVLGNVYEINSNALYVDNKTITIAKNTPTAALADQSGVVVDGANASILYNYNAGNDKFVINKGIDVLNGTVNTTNITATFATVNGNAIVAGNIIASNIRTNSLIVNGVELITGAGNITVNNITANIWTGLYTANVIESASNLYYTNARVFSALANANLNLNNVTATFATVNGNAIITGNVVASNIIANSLIINGVELITGTGSIKVSNITSNSAIINGNAVVTGNVVASNIIANSLIINGVELITGTGNITVNTITSNTWAGLYTANVIETSSNLYFTNARTIAAVTNTTLSNLTVSGNIIVSSTGSINGGNLIQSNTILANTFVSAGIGVPEINSLTNINLNANSAIGGAVVIGTSPLRIRSYGLSDIANLFPSIGDVIFNSNVGTMQVWNGSAWSNNSGSTVFSNISISGNAVVAGNIVATSIVVNGVELITGPGNLTANNISSNTWTNLYTANVIESVSNLYYTNTRARFSISPFDQSIIYDAPNGLIRANVSYITGSQIASGSIPSVPLPGYGTGLIYCTCTNIVTANNVITNSLQAQITSLNTDQIAEGQYTFYYTNSRVYSNVIELLPTLSGTGISIDANGIISVNANTNQITEGSNLYYTDTRVYSNVITLLPTLSGTGISIDANGIISANTINTDQVTEGSNLYYTNTRVYSNVIGFLPTLAGTGISIDVNGIISANTTGASSSNIFSNIFVDGNSFVTGNVITNTLYANSIILQNINVTSNILTGTIASGNSYSDTIVSQTIYSNVWQNLYTSNVSEKSGNLYFTNARVYSNVISLLPTYTGNSGLTLTTANQPYITSVGKLSALSVTGNIITGNIITTSITSNIWNNLYTSNVIETNGNLYYTNARVISAVTPYLTTSNVIETNGNLYYTNARVISAVTPYLTTANVNEFDGNLYYTNARVISAVTPYLTTSNVIETNGNLYYTNTRVNSNVITLLPTLAGNGITITANGQISANTVVTVTAFSNITVTGNISAGNISDTVIITTSVINSNVWNNLYTANVIETSGNLYFTNSRVINALTNATISNITLSSNVVVGAGGTISGANLISGTVIQGSQWQGIYTSNVIETGSNLYYTDTRARNALSGGTGVTYYNSNGQISIGQDVSQTANVVFNSATILGNLTVLGNSITFSANSFTVADSLIELGTGNSGDTLDIGFYGLYNTGIARYSGMFRDASDGKFKFFSNLTVKPTNILVDTANASFKYGTLVVDHLEGNVTGYVSTIGNFSTTNLVEGINLYYTNARAQSAITALDNSIIYYQSNGGIQANVSYITSTISSSVSGLTTANVTEVASNLYFTNARVYANISPLLTTANIKEISSNLYYTNSRVYSNVIGFLPSLSGPGISIAANGQISANATTSSNVSFNNISSNIWTNLYTANVIETAGNLYFTDTRSRSSISAGDTSIIYDAANGTIRANTTTITTTITEVQTVVNNLSTSNVTEGTNLYYTNARVYANVTELLPTYTGNITTGNIATNGVVSYGNVTAGPKVVQIYNSITNSLDTIFL
jgi:hypothetical protein